MEFLDFDKAKKVFINYGGSHFQMVREGEYEFYKKYNISPEVEYNWLKEMQYDLLNKLNNTSNSKIKAQYFSDYGRIVTQLKDLNGLEFMLDYVKKNLSLFDSNTMLRNVNTILNSIGIIEENKLKSTVVTEALFILKCILSKPIKVSNDYMEDGELPDYLSNEIIVANIKDTIKFWESTV